MSATAPTLDPFDARIAARAPGLLHEFNAARVLSAADVHVAQRLAEAGGRGSELVMLAAALAVRGPRLGHVFVDLATIADTASVESEEPVDLSALPWPEPRRGWLRWSGASSSRGARTPPKPTGRCGSSAPGSIWIATGVRSGAWPPTCRR